MDCAETKPARALAPTTARSNLHQMITLRTEGEIRRLIRPSGSVRPLDIRECSGLDSARVGVFNGG